MPYAIVPADPHPGRANPDVYSSLTSAAPGTPLTTDTTSPPVLQLFEVVTNTVMATSDRTPASVPYAQLVRCGS